MADRWEVVTSDALVWLQTLPDDSADAGVMDPPAGISFMQAAWDSDKGGSREWIRWLSEILAELHRVLNPGAHILVWSIPRTSHWTGQAIERAGFQIRDCVTHLFGSGFPKSANVSKAIDRHLGHEPIKVGTKPSGGASALSGNCTDGEGSADTWRERGGEEPGTAPVTRPATPEGEAWDGWGSALKPAAELWWLARVPIDGTIAANVLEHGVGGLNIAGCRVGNDSITTRINTAIRGGKFGLADSRGCTQDGKEHIGRYPPNLLLSHGPDCTEDACAPWCPIAMLDEQSGEICGSNGSKGGYPATAHGGGFRGGTPAVEKSKGGASRFFPRFRYQAKPSRREREAGLDAFPLKSAKKFSEDGIQGRRDEKASEVIASAEVHSQGLDARGRMLIREDGSRTLVDRWIPQHRANTHPTAKSIELMRWLIRLITPPGGLILDPFTGSGSTGCAAMLEGACFAGSELSEEYARIARARIAHAAGETVELEPLGNARTPRPPTNQLSLF